MKILGFLSKNNIFYKFKIIIFTKFKIDKINNGENNQENCRKNVSTIVGCN